MTSYRRYAYLALILCILIVPASAAGQARRRGATNRGGAAPQPPTDQVATIENPWAIELLGQLEWAQALAISNERQRSAAIEPLLAAYGRKEPKRRTGTLAVSFSSYLPAPNSSSRTALTAIFESHGQLPDGAPYHVIARVRLTEAVSNGTDQVALNKAAMAKAENVFQPGTLYLISGSVDASPAGQDSPSQGTVKVAEPRPPAVAVNFNFSIRPDIKPYDAAAFAAAEPMARAIARAGDKPAPAAQRSDVLVLVPPAHREWASILSDSAQPTQLSLINTIDDEGQAVPAKLRIDAGAQPTQFKKWIYAFVLDSPQPDDPTKLGTTSRMDYALYYRAGDQDAPLLLVRGTVSDIADLPGRPNEFVHTLFSGALAADLSRALAAKVYADGTPTSLILGDKRRREMVYPVHIITLNGQKTAAFALDNHLPVPVEVCLKLGKIRPSPVESLWDWQDPTFTTARVLLRSGEKQTFNVPITPSMVADPGFSSAAAFINDSRVKPIEK